MTGPADSHDAEPGGDDFDDVDLESLERESAAVEKKEQFTDYRRTTDGVVARDEYVGKAAVGETELETKILKIAVISLAILIPCLVLYLQSGGSADDDKTPAEQIERPVEPQGEWQEETPPANN